MQNDFFEFDPNVNLATNPLSICGNGSIFDVPLYDEFDAATAAGSAPRKLLKDIVARLSPLIAVGLDYMPLGQAVPTLSGGEAQRLKLAGYIANARTRRRGEKEKLLFLFDEPTTGLHFADIDKLIGAFTELLEAGHSLIVIEHNLDLIRAADWLVDLGPEGGDAGGEVIAVGSPAQVAAAGIGHTAAALNEPPPKPARRAAKATASSAAVMVRSRRNWMGSGLSHPPTG